MHFSYLLEISYPTADLLAMEEMAMKLQMADTNNLVNASFTTALKDVRTELSVHLSMWTKLIDTRRKGRNKTNLILLIPTRQLVMREEMMNH